MGKFQKADGGTLFLDEVGDMSLKTQAKVLRVLEEQRFEPVGAQESVRWMCAGGGHQQKSRRRNRERKFSRGSVLPAQRDPVSRAATAGAQGRYPGAGGIFPCRIRAGLRTQPKELTPQALQMLQEHHWPGNVRELRNLIERIVILNPQSRSTRGTFRCRRAQAAADKPANAMAACRTCGKRPSANTSRRTSKKLRERQPDSGMLGLSGATLPQMRALGIAPRE